MTRPHVIRVFISSTFRDMHAERDYLNRFVFPELRARSLRHGLEFVAVDLRWGVTQQEAEQRGALNICLAEIDRCRPFFVGLLGDRYGWVPPPDDIPLEAFQDFRHNPSTTAEDAARLDQWYRLDETVYPAVYRLRRDEPVPAEVAVALIHLWQTVGLPHAGESITAREIQHALSHARRMYPLFYLRQSRLHRHPDFPAVLLPVFVEPDPARRDKLAALKRSLREAARGVVGEYAAEYGGLRIDPALLPGDLSSAERDSLEDGVVQPAEWARLSPKVQAALNQHGTVALSGLEPWGEQVLRDLWAAIETELSEARVALDAHEQERAYHERFLQERTDLFYGRKGLLQRVLAYAASPKDRVPLVITGAPGCGKSALLAECARLCRAQFPDAVVLPHFIGVAPGSTVLTTTIRSLCEELKRACALEDEIPADADELRRQLPFFLEKAGTTRPVILLLDALNQLDPAARSHELHWLPFHVPPGTRLVLSTLPGPSLDQLRGRAPPDHIIDVPALPETDREALVRAHLARRGKKLTPDQIARLLDAQARPDAGLPLYVLVALEELCLFGSYSALETRLDRLPATLPALFDQVLARLEHDHGRQRTESILLWLAVSRSGLLEAEILDLLEMGEPGIPRLRWTQFYRALEFYLRRIDETGPAGLLDFFHDQLRLAVYRRYLAMNTPQSPPSDSFRRGNVRLATYFRSIAVDPDAPLTWRMDRPRGLGELPYHQARGARWEELARTLSGFGFMQAKLSVFGPQPLLEDYDLALAPATPYSTDTAAALRLIQSALRLASHIVAEDARQLAGQFLGRLSAVENPPIQAMLEQVREQQTGPWLRPSSMTLVPADGPQLRTLRDPRDYSGISSLAVTPDWQFAVSCSRDGSLTAWDLVFGAKLRTLTSDPSITAVAVTPDGRQAVSGSQDGALQVWDVRHGEQPLSLGRHETQVRALAVTPDGARAISACEDTTLALWDLRRRRRLFTLQGHEEPAHSVCSSPDGQMAISCDRYVWIEWDLARGGLLRKVRLQPYAAIFLCMAMTPEGSLAVLGSARGFLKVWDLLRQEDAQALVLDGCNIFGLAAASNGRCVLSGNFGRMEEQWDVQRQRPLFPARCEGYFLEQRDGWGWRRIAPRHAHTWLELWDPQREPALFPLYGHSNMVTAVLIEPDGRQAISASDDGTIKTWDLDAAGLSQAALQRHLGPVHAVAVTPDGSRALSVSFDRTVKVWDVRSGELLHTGGHDHRARVVASTPDGRQAITGCDDGTFRVWELKRGRLRRTVRPDEGFPVAVEVTADGKCAVSATHHGLSMWNLRRGRVRLLLTGLDEAVTALAVAKEGWRAIAGLHGGTVKAWDLKRCREELSVDVHKGEVTAVALTPDGRRAVSAGEDGTVWFWDLERGDVPRRLGKHKYRVTALAVDRRGHWVVSAPLHGLTVWDVRRGRKAHTFGGYRGPITALCLLSDGRRCLSASEDSRLRVWDLQTGELVACFTGETAFTDCALAADEVTVVVGEASGRVHFLRLEEVA